MPRRSSSRAARSRRRSPTATRVTPVASRRPPTRISWLSGRLSRWRRRSAGCCRKTAWPDAAGGHTEDVADKDFAGKAARRAEARHEEDRGREEDDGDEEEHGD